MTMHGCGRENGVPSMTFAACTDEAFVPILSATFSLRFVVAEAFNAVASWSWLQKSLLHLNGCMCDGAAISSLQNINKQLKMYDSIWSCYFRERVDPAAHNPIHDGCHFVPTKYILYFMSLRTHTKAFLSRNSSFSFFFLFFILNSLFFC